MNFPSADEARDEILENRLADIKTAIEIAVEYNEYSCTVDNLITKEIEVLKEKGYQVYLIPNSCRKYKITWQYEKK